jgi:hypothetical protein
MDYSIQQLTLIHQSIQSSVDYKAEGAQEQLIIIKVLNSEHLISKEGLPSLTVRDVLQDAKGNGGVAATAVPSRPFATTQATSTVAFTLTSAVLPAGTDEQR